MQGNFDPHIRHWILDRITDGEESSGKINFVLQKDASNTMEWTWEEKKKNHRFPGNGNTQNNYC